MLAPSGVLPPRGWVKSEGSNVFANLGICYVITGLDAGQHLKNQA
jgi:hypothetical protein